MLTHSRIDPLPRIQRPSDSRLNNANTMEPVLTLSYYVQLREQIDSFVQFEQNAALPVRNASATADVGGQYSSIPTCIRRGGSHAGGPSLPAAGIEQEHETPNAEHRTPNADLSDIALATSERQTHDLDDAFDAMVEEMKFDWPESSPVDRIKTGLIESALGLLLFMALIAGVGFLHQYLIH